MTATDLSKKSDAEIRTWIQNHERQNATTSALYLSLVEEEARRKGRGLHIETSLRHLISCARTGQFTTYGDLAAANNLPWNEARHRMNGAGGHLDQLLSVCHARNLPLFPSICVNQSGVLSGQLSPEALEGFVKGAQRLGIAVADANDFLNKSQSKCFEWGRNHP